MVLDNNKIKLDPKNLLFEINTNGIAEINDFIDEKRLNKLQNFIYEEIDHQPKEYVGCIGEENLKNSPLLNIDIDYGITEILESLRLQISDRKNDDKKSYQRLRVLSPKNKEGLKEAYKFHYDAYVLTALLPIIIPDRDDEMNGDFIYFINRRKLHKNFLRNIVEKFLIQNPFSYYLLKKKSIQNFLDLKVCKLKPGKLYIFFGFQTIHTNKICNLDSIRATALFHYSDPFSENFLFNIVEKLNILRTNLKLQNKK